jgi:hypothetical protein
MTFTRIAGRYPTRAAAENARRWAARYSVRVPLELRRHECAQPRHQCEPWLLVSVVRVGEETEPVVAAVGANGHPREGG